MTVATARRHRDPPVRRPLAEAGRLRAELAALRALVAALAAADCGPMVTVAAAREWAAQARADGYEAGRTAGYLEAVADIKAVQRDLVRVFGRSAPDLSPWHVCCGPCRRGGHRTGCCRCEDRTRETFGQPHPDERRAAAGLLGDALAGR